MTGVQTCALPIYIKSDRTLRFEIRIGKVIIYFKKCKALEISSTNMTVDKNYFIDENDIINPNISTPKDYFNQIKTVINKWQKFKVNKEEFDSQQKIALANDINNRYFIIDMEYSFSRSFIEKIKERPKRVLFDLVGIDKETNSLVLFELKKGKGAIKGKAGIEAHKNDFECYFRKENKYQLDFIQHLKTDVENIIRDKQELGFIEKDFNVDKLLLSEVPQFAFIYYYEQNENIKDIEKIVEPYKLLFVSYNNYVLK